MPCNYKIVTFVSNKGAMGTKEKLIERFKKQLSDFTFDEMESMFSLFGYVKPNKGKTSGSRIIYKNGDKRPICCTSHIRETLSNHTQ